jgi:pimeloyl-ACP methyl ester carboxylesterase
LAIGALLWLAPMALLTGVHGTDHTLTQMGLFFTSVALLFSYHGTAIVARDRLSERVMQTRLIAIAQRATRTACLLLLAASLAACAAVSSYVSVDRLDLRAAYRQYTDNVLSSGELSQPTRQALNLVPEASDARDVGLALAALARSARISDADRAYARAEIALRAANQFEATDPQRARPWYLLAARESARLLFPQGRMLRIDPFDQRYRFAAGFYSLATGRYFLALMRAGPSWTGDIVESTPGGPLNVAFADEESVLIAYFFRDFSLAWGDRITGLRNRYLRDGIGVPLVARRAPGVTFPLERYFPAGGYTAPVTVYLRFEPAARTGDPERALIGVVDSRNVENVCFSGQSLPIAADFTAPYAHQIAQDRSRKAGRAALFGDAVPGTRFGITISAPWDPAKIPLVMVHGLASSAEAWRELTNDVLGSEELRERFQIVHYTYPTTEPVLSSAAVFRRTLREFLRDVEYDPAVSPKLVVVGHSMGGLLAKSLTVDSGLSIWNSVFDAPPDKLRGPDEARRAFEESLILQPWPEVGRVIFLGVPHRGSPVADGFLGWFGRRLIDLPGEFTGRLLAIAQTDDNQIRPDVREFFRRGRVTSVQSLSPGYPPGQAFAALAVAADVPVHSVIGNAQRRPDGRGFDGYVTVDSASIDGAASELILPVKHMDFDRAEPLNEIYRILRLHGASIRGAADGSAPLADALSDATRCAASP